MWALRCPQPTLIWAGDNSVKYAFYKKVHYTK